MHAKPSLRVSLKYAGWARTRGLLRPYVEVGALGVTLMRSAYFGALMAHEHVHRVERHALQRLVLCTLSAVGFTILGWLAWSWVDVLAGMVSAVFFGLTAWMSVGLLLTRWHERRADAFAAEKQGRLWHRLLSDLVYVKPTPLDVLIYGSREQRLRRVLEAAKRSENFGYAPGGVA